MNRNELNNEDINYMTFDCTVSNVCLYITYTMPLRIVN